jgi:hypothetical protein
MAEAASVAPRANAAEGLGQDEEEGIRLLVWLGASTQSGPLRSTKGAAAAWQISLP